MVVRPLPVSNSSRAGVASSSRAGSDTNRPAEYSNGVEVGSMSDRTARSLQAFGRARPRAGRKQADRQSGPRNRPRGAPAWVRHGTDGGQIRPPPARPVVEGVRPSQNRRIALQYNDVPGLGSSATARSAARTPERRQRGGPLSNQGPGTPRCSSGGPITPSEDPASVGEPPRFDFVLPVDAVLSRERSSDPVVEGLPRHRKGGTRPDPPRRALDGRNPVRCDPEEPANFAFLGPFRPGRRGRDEPGVLAVDLEVPGASPRSSRTDPIAPGGLGPPSPLEEPDR